MSDTNNEFHVVLLATWLQNPTKSGPLSILRKVIKADPTALDRACRMLLEWRRNGLDEEGYKHECGETFDESLARVTQGDVKSACQLVRWNKVFLGCPEMVTFLLCKEAFGNREDLRLLADSISKVRRKQVRKHWFLIGILKNFLRKDPEMSVRDLSKCAELFGEELSEREWPDDEPTLAILRDKKEIRKFITRNKSLIY